MKNRGLLNRLFPLTLLVVLSLTLTGCVAQLGTSWAGVTLLSSGTEVVFAYEDNLAVVDIVEGEAAPLTDSEGFPRLDDSGNPLVWEVSGRDLQNVQFFASPLEYADDVLLTMTLDRRLLKFDLPSARLIDTEGVLVEGRGSAVTPLLRADDVLFVGLQERLSALDAETFDTLWSLETQHGVWSEPFVLDEIAYFTSLDHYLYAIEIASGDVLWSLDLGGASAGTPAYDPETESLFIGTFESRVLKVSLDGEVTASYETDQWVWGSPVLVDGMLYVSDLDGMVYKLDPETLTEGDNGWKSQVANGAIRTTPLVFGDYVVVGSRDQSVYWLNRDTGNEVFKRALDGEVLANLLYVEQDDELGIEMDMIVVSTLSNRELLVAFEADNGERLWTYRR